MAFFKSRKEREERADATLTRLYEAQSKQAEIMTDFLRSVADMSVRRAAAALGTRSAKVRKERKLGKQASACPLCENPSRADVTIEMIGAHRHHAPVIPVVREEPPDDTVIQ